MIFRIALTILEGILGFTGFLILKVFGQPEKEFNIENKQNLFVGGIFWVLILVIVNIFVKSGGWP